MSLLDLFIQRPRRINCKPGDLARIIRGVNRDRLVHVICEHERIGLWTVKSLQRMYDYRRGYDFEPGALGTVDDASLRPIRGLPGEDETLRWAGKPEPKTWVEAAWQAIGEARNVP